MRDPIEGLHDSLGEDAQTRLRAGLSRAQAVVSQLPLVCRMSTAETEKLTGARPMLNRPSEKRKQVEIDAFGSQVRVYFYLGAGCYPEPAVAWLVRRDGVRTGSFTPFDSGGVFGGKARPTIPGDPTAAEWARLPVRVRTVAEHAGASSDVVAFTADYLAIHFDDPLDYVRRSQISDMDYPVYHGLRGPNRDRRDWTVEVQSYDGVPVDASSGTVAEVVVLGRPRVHGLLESAYPVTMALDDGGKDPLLRKIAERIESTIEGSNP